MDYPKLCRFQEAIQQIPTEVHRMGVAPSPARAEGRWPVGLTPRGCLEPRLSAVGAR